MDGPVVVITGSTRGIGYGLAEAFLARGCRVVVSGRTAEAVERAVASLGGERVAGRACAVHESSALEALYELAEGRFGRVDVWINNAGRCNAVRSFAELTSEELVEVADTNVRGTFLGSHVAARRFARQGHGQLFNMEGWGSNGERKAGMTPYCATKLAIRYFTDELGRELAREAPGVRVGTLSPGMVVTDSLVDSYARGEAVRWTSWRWLFRFIIDPREVVCTWLADRVLSNRRTRARYAWITPLRLFVRFLQPKYWRRNPVAGTALDHIGRDAP